MIPSKSGERKNQSNIKQPYLHHNSPSLINIGRPASLSRQSVFSCSFLLSSSEEQTSSWAVMLVSASLGRTLRSNSRRNSKYLCERQMKKTNAEYHPGEIVAAGRWNHRDVLVAWSRQRYFSRDRCGRERSKVVAFAALMGGGGEAWSKRMCVCNIREIAVFVTFGQTWASSHGLDSALARWAPVVKVHLEDALFGVMIVGHR